MFIDRRSAIQDDFLFGYAVDQRLLHVDKTFVDIQAFLLFLLTV